MPEGNDHRGPPPLLEAAVALEPLGGWLCQVERFLRRYVVLSDDQAAAVALWVAHTHAFAAATATPYLAITSAEKRSGKTRLLEVLRLVVANAWFTGSTSKAALVRKVDRDAPSLLLDESDAAFNGDKEYAEALRGVLNTGYRRGGSVTVCVGQGAKITVQDFSTFCAKAIAGLGALPDTVADRAIPIRLKRRATSEPVERFRERTARSIGEALADSLEGSLGPLIETLRGAEPELPDELDDRAWDVWEPLLAIADIAGGEWPDRARGASKRLSADQEPDDETLGVRLLADCRDAFGDEQRIPTGDLRQHLHSLEEAPWGDWYGKPISARKVADLLRRFGIRSRKIRFDDGPLQGYERAAFEDAWARYLPLSNRNNQNNGSIKPEAGTSDPEHEAGLFRVENAGKPHEQANVPLVPDSPTGYATERGDRR